MKLIATFLLGILLVGVMWIHCASPVHADIHYVVQGGTGSGASLFGWHYAAGSIQTAIDYASSGDEIWVAAGTYTGSFTVPSGIKIFGGFSGDESVRDDRYWRTNVTIISGGAISATGSSSAMSAIDGFKFTNCSSITLTGNVVFSHNTATGNTTSSDETPLFTCSGQVILVNNLIYGNSCPHGDNFVGIRCISNQGEPILTNNTIANNGDECALAISCSDCTSAATLSNNIVIGGTGISSGTTNPVLSYNCVPTCPCGSYVNFLPLNWTPPATEISADPQFVGSPNFRLQSTSPCIDIQGANNAINSSSIPDFAKSKDLDGKPRIYNNYVDIGLSITWTFYF